MISPAPLSAACKGEIAMPKLGASVGQPSGLNKKHDVALVQAMLQVIKNPKNQPYATFKYDGEFGLNGATFKAIKAFQEDHKTNLGPPPEPLGKIELNGKTFSKMVELLPASHKGLRGLEGYPIVYLEGTQAELNAAVARVTGDGKFTAEFKGKVVALFNKFYQKYGIVLSVNPDFADGGFRDFATQRKLMDRVLSNGDMASDAGPGESNHNWGNGADIGFTQFYLLNGNGTIARVPGVAVSGDGAWLSELEKISPAAVAELWTARNNMTDLYQSKKIGDKPHLQTFSDTKVSMGKSLAEHMSIEGCMWWKYEAYSYWCNYGLADKETKFKVGSAKRIWDSSVNVDEASLATALNQAEARRKLGPLPEYEEAIRKAIVELTPSPPAVWKKTDIKKAHCDMMRIFFRVDFELAEASAATWKPYDKDGNPM